MKIELLNALFLCLLLKVTFVSNVLFSSLKRLLLFFLTRKIQLYIFFVVNIALMITVVESEDFEENNNNTF